MSPIDAPRSLLTWSLAHGVQRTLLLRGARKGDLISRLAIDPEVTADPFASYEVLRQRGPVSANDYISVSVDHAVCDEVLRSEQFGVGGGHAELPRPAQRLLAKVTDPQTLGPIDPPSMLAVDPPQHTRYRRLVSRWFTARKVGRMSDRVTDVAERLLDDLADTPRFDLVDRYAALLPVTVISDLLGVPESKRDRVLELGNLAAVTLDPALTFRRFRAAESALRELHAMFADHVATLRREPGDDLLSALVTGADADRLTDTELHSIGLLVLGAGFETTVNLISNAVGLLDAHPDQRAWLAANPDGWENAVEEVLRLESPVQVTLRVALTETEVAGRRFLPGHGILGYLGGANRDPQVFDDPARFDVRRANAHEHLGFSAGVHFCLGASLARLEATVALRLLYERYPDLRVVGSGERRTTRVLRGWEHLPVATTATVPA